MSVHNGHLLWRLYGIVKISPDTVSLYNLKNDSNGRVMFTQYGINYNGIDKLKKYDGHLNKIINDFALTYEGAIVSKFNNVTAFRKYNK